MQIIKNIKKIVILTYANSLYHSYTFTMLRAADGSASSPTRSQVATPSIIDVYKYKKKVDQILNSYLPCLPSPSLAVFKNLF